VTAESIDACSRHLTDEILDAFSVAGTPAECARKLVEVASTGVQELAMVALPVEGQTVDDLARRLATQVLPEVRSMLDKPEVSGRTSSGRATT
jgi:alkanesulfonate monooxygenase SsuD/methylene tetrahydromethanopterin reductase-like flavin-dependent oxidoreductase (luciferase family)